MKYRVIADTKAKAGYEFRGGCRKLHACRDPQVVLAGPSDTGKTVAACVKLHLTCLKYPESQHAIVRKTYSSMSGSVLQTFARVVKGAGVTTHGGVHPTRFTYPNGATIWAGGLDNPEKTLSSERDTIYANQTEELTLSDWEMLSRACSGRGAVVAFPQLMGDCNPGGSLHWIREQAKAGKLALLAATHRDNPTIYHADGSLVKDGETVNGLLVKIGGEKRLAALSNLSGVRRKRLFEGVWATVEGAVYDMFDAATHVLVRDWREMQRFFLAIDEGYTNPVVVLLIGEDGDGRWHCFKEFYKAGVLQDVVVKLVQAWNLDPVGAIAGILTPAGSDRQQVRRVAVDEAAAGLIADLRNNNVNAVGGKGRVLDGINAIQNRLQMQRDGKPRYTVDPGCVNHINEFESYVWNDKSIKDAPKKENDHSMDAVRYLDHVSGSTGAFRGGERLHTGMAEEGDLDFSTIEDNQI